MYPPACPPSRMVLIRGVTSENQSPKNNVKKTQMREHLWLATSSAKALAASIRRPGISIRDVAIICPQAGIPHRREGAGERENAHIGQIERLLWRPQPTRAPVLSSSLEARTHITFLKRHLRRHDGVEVHGGAPHVQDHVAQRLEHLRAHRLREDVRTVRSRLHTWTTTTSPIR